MPGCSSVGRTTRAGRGPPTARRRPGRRCGRQVRVVTPDRCAECRRFCGTTPRLTGRRPATGVEPGSRVPAGLVGRTQARRRSATTAVAGPCSRAPDFRGDRLVKSFEHREDAFGVAGRLQPRTVGEHVVDLLGQQQQVPLPPARRLLVDRPGMQRRVCQRATAAPPTASARPVIRAYPQLTAFTVGASPGSHRPSRVSDATRDRSGTPTPGPAARPPSTPAPCYTALVRPGFTPSLPAVGRIGRTSGARDSRTRLRGRRRRPPPTSPGRGYRSGSPKLSSGSTVHSCSPGSELPRPLLSGAGLSGSGLCRVSALSGVSAPNRGMTAARSSSVAGLGIGRAVRVGVTGPRVARGALVTVPCRRRWCGTTTGRCGSRSPTSRRIRSRRRRCRPARRQPPR